MFNKWDIMADEDSECLIHFSTTSKDEDILITATRTSICKIIECRARWNVLNGEARNVSQRSLDYIDEAEGEHLVSEKETTLLPGHFFYHRKCYQKFTNKRLIQQAEKRTSKREGAFEHSNEIPRKSRRTSTEYQPSTSSSSASATSTSTSTKKCRNFRPPTHCHQITGYWRVYFDNLF